jgi:hypothetical protein
MPVQLETISSANISVSGVNVEPAVAGALTIDSGYTLTVPTIPVTCYRVFIRNVGSLLEGGIDTDILVGGDNLQVGESRTFEARFDPVTNVYKYVSGLNITNVSGAGIYFEIDY